MAPTMLQHLSFIRLAERRPRRQTPNRRNTANRRRPASPVPRTLFHAPSFSAGVVMGAVIVLGAAYLPELLGRDAGATPTTAPASKDEPRKLEFEFDDLLRNSRVVADPEPYASELPHETSVEEEILLQAASFRSREDADQLRARLLLQDLPATTSIIELSNGTWYRVTVGPFTSQVKAQRALTRLREQNLAAMWTRRRVE